ncbi:MarR family transcriptional regulator [Solwaraspora sp. WMMD1047]|uniref:MarR family winged helix-turn-helix transcriptional regulator n=1 Tax=Solwaraspora sp. WMMD1047 TaxID=3016102 RepID=UPI002417636F|nr:MarR family transcriptional regulator [Solwaraspora sp. WMMD1047]MDG4834300.1 MarR family transcriptional regulator [Solwaraspora sp. WMMD1047]
MEPAPRTTDLASGLRVVVGRLYRQFRQNQDGELTPSQLSNLVTIEAYGPLRLGELAEREGVAPGTLSKGIDWLQTRGLVSRIVDPQDRRSSFVCVTDAGQQLLDQLRETRTARFAQRIELLDDRQRAVLVEAIEVLEALLTPAPEPAPAQAAAPAPEKAGPPAAAGHTPVTGSSR